MNLIKFMPPAKSKRWFLWMAVYALLLWLLIVLYRFVLLGEPVNALLLLRLAVFAVLVSAVLNGLGWLGIRLLWLTTSLGIAVGLALMFIYTYRDMSGWEDLAGFLAFVLCMLGGFALGILAEGVQLLLNYRRKS